MFKINLKKIKVEGLPDDIPRIQLAADNHEITYVSNVNAKEALAYVTEFRQDLDFPDRIRKKKLLYEWTGRYWRFVKNFN